MAHRELPGIGDVYGFFALGADDWDGPNSSPVANVTSKGLRKLSVLCQLSVKSIAASVPASPAPSAGDIYIVGDDDVAVYDKDDEGSDAWIYYTPVRGWRAYVEDEQALYVYDGSSWTLLNTGGASGASSGSGATSGGGGSSGQVYDIALSLPGVTFTAGQKILEFTVGRDSKFNLNAGVSECSCDTAPTSQADFVVKLEGVEQGKLRIASSQTTGTGVATTSQPFDADRDEVITIFAPSSADATIEGFHCTIWGETR